MTILLKKFANRGILNKIVNKTFVIVTHYMLYGASQALRDFLIKKKTKEVIFIGHPLLNEKTTIIKSYLEGQENKIKKIKRFLFLGLVNYIFDFFITILYLMLSNKRTDLYIGVNPLNCFAGIFLKKLKKVKKVVFYSIDFSPVRFRNKLLNYVFHKIEVFCLENADEAWNVSPRIAEGREKFLGVLQNKFIQKVVPIGVWNEDIKKRDFKDIKKHQLLFVGHLLEKQGVQLVLDAIPGIVRKIPDFKFVVVGGGKYEKVLREKIKKLRIENYVAMTGWIRERKELDAMMSESACAVAVYKPEEERIYNFTYYADPTKLKDYLGAGLPIILTDVSYNAKGLERKKCAIIVDYDKKSLSDAVTKLMKNANILKEYRENTKAVAKQLEWSKIFSNALNYE